MTQQPFDPMDKLLREALASDALPPSGAGTETILSIRELAGQLGTSHLHTHGYTMT